MTLRIVVLGYEVATVELDLGEPAEPRRVTPVDRGIKALSNFWVRRMNS